MSRTIIAGRPGCEGVSRAERWLVSCWFLFADPEQVASTDNTCSQHSPTHMARNVNKEPPGEWLVDIHPHRILMSARGSLFAIHAHILADALLTSSWRGGCLCGQRGSNTLPLRTSAGGASNFHSDMGVSRHNPMSARNTMSMLAAIGSLPLISLDCYIYIYVFPTD